MWCQEGGDPDRFWKQTPRTLHHYFKGKVEAARIRRNEARATAWHTERYARLKRLPDLGKELAAANPKDDGKGKGGEILAFMHELKAKGIPMRIRKKAKVDG